MDIEEASEVSEAFSIICTKDKVKEYSPENPNNPTNPGSVYIISVDKTKKVVTNGMINVSQGQCE